MSIVRQERLLWTTLGLAAGAVSYLDIKVRVGGVTAEAHARTSHAQLGFHFFIFLFFSPIPSHSWHSFFFASLHTQRPKLLHATKTDSPPTAPFLSPPPPPSTIIVSAALPLELHVHSRG